MDRRLLIDELIVDEDLRPKPYLDKFGKVTIGVGRNLTDKGLSRDEIFYLLNNDIDEAVGELDHHVPWWKELSEARQLVLVNMCFNMGITRLLGFRKMLAHLQAGRYGEAAVEMRNSEWYNQVGVRATRLEDAMRKGAP